MIHDVPLDLGAFTALCRAIENGDGIAFTGKDISRNDDAQMQVKLTPQVLRQLQVEKAYKKRRGRG